MGEGYFNNEMEESCRECGNHFGPWERGGSARCLYCEPKLDRGKIIWLSVCIISIYRATDGQVVERIRTGFLLGKCGLPILYWHQDYLQS